MESKVIVLTPDQITQFLQPIVARLDALAGYFLKDNNKHSSVYTEAEAAAYLKCSKKKLQTLRNAREIGFIRENGGRKIRFKHEHLIEYMQQHELKKKK